MSGYTRISLVIGLIALVICLALAAGGLGWGLACVVPVAALGAGYIGGSWSKDDPSKTARNARRGALAGLTVTVLGLFGRLAASFLAPDGAALNALQDGCLFALSLMLGAALGGIGGWAYVRHEHERQTGYKPT